MLYRVWAHGLSALIAVHRGEDTAADRHIDAVADLDLDLSQESFWYPSLILRVAEAIRAERRGDAAGALAAAGAAR